MAAAHRADAGDRIPCCPDWTRDDLVTHTTSVYRWVELIVRGARNRPPALPEPESDPLADPGKALSAAHHDVLEALRTAPAERTASTRAGVRPRTCHSGHRGDRPVGGAASAALEPSQGHRAGRAGRRTRTGRLGPRSAPLTSDRAGDFWLVY
ncbi:maleylpyruvate isomerase N-terminal domain-containing protein [Amycolatopsis sp. DSM 110486]|nr:maleylpyruvate isomerase N-terminal domain-containing protein [Amycolatopsis sp. DSM 110486]